MSSANKPVDEQCADHTGPTFFPLEDVLNELRALVRAHLDEGALVLEAAGIRLAFTIAITMLAVLAVMLAWAIACAAGLYYLSLATSLPWAIVIGVAAHLAIAVALFRFACGEIGRIKAYFSANAPAGESRSDYTAVN